MNMSGVTQSSAFKPDYGTGVSRTVAGAGSGSSNIDGAASQVMLSNLGDNVVYIRLSKDSAAATTADMPLLAGAQVVVTKGFGDVFIGWYSPTGTTFHTISGAGL